MRRTIRDTDTRYAARMYMLCVLLPCLALVIIGVIACATAKAALPTGTVAVSCFDKASWSTGTVAVSHRPCTTITAPDNDSVYVIQGTARKEQAECQISTATVRDAYCYRIGANRGMSGPGYTRANPHGAQAACTAALHLCAATMGPAEDGSVSITIYSAGHRIERCTLGNPAEEQGVYYAPCTR